MFKHKKNLLKRLLATALDYALYFLALSVYILLLGEDTADGTKSVTNLMALPLPFFWFVYFVVIEAHYGATLGHQALNLLVLGSNRKDISFTQALKRRLADLVDFSFLGVPAIILIRNSSKCQRLGDIWADTIVVDTKDREQYPLPYKKTIKNA